MEQKESIDWRKTIFAASVSIASILFSAFTFSAFYAGGTLVANSGVSASTIDARLVQDVIIRLGFPLMICIAVLIKKKSVASLGFTKQSLKPALALAVVYLALFVLFGDKTLTGFYLWAYYLLGVAFAEELVFRGYLFQRLYAAFGQTPKAAVAAGIASGVLWGIAHAAIPVIVGGQPVLSAMLSNVGMGIIVGSVFSFALYKSKSLYVPILMHAIIDYLGVIF